jgi:hypothetical protein
MKIEFEESDQIKPGYTRVSEILKPLADFSGVIESDLKRASDRGSEIHRAIAFDAEDLFYPLKAAYQPYFDSYLRWKAVTGYQIVESEVRLYDDELLITGKFDAIVQGVNSPKLFLVDWKNTYAQNREYWEHQGMFYHKLCEINGINLASRVMFVQLQSDGTVPKVHSFEVSETLWRQCLKLYWQLKVVNN